MTIPDIRAEIRKKQEELAAKLAKIPVVEVIGVVGGLGPGAGRSGGETEWTMHFELAAWRVAGEGVRRSVMRVSKKLSDAEWQAQKNCVSPDTVVRLRGRVAEVEVGNIKARLQLEEVLGADDSDAEMNAVLQELKKEVVYEDEMLGRLVFDRQIKWYEKEIMWVGQKAALYVHGQNEQEVRGMIGTAHALFKGEARWSKAVLECAAKELLPLKNDSWLGDDEKEVTTEEFMRRMELEAITVEENGNFEFCFKDGDLFWGHAILVRGNIEKGMKRAEIAG